VATNTLNTEVNKNERIHDRKWLWLSVCAFVAAEWVILFSPDLCHSFNFIRQRPQAVSCTDWKNPETAYLNLKTWVIVSLSQAAVWGAVFFASIRCGAAVWQEGESRRRQRAVAIIFRVLIFGLGLKLFLDPAPRWDLGCFSAHISARGSAAAGYFAVGAAAVVMWMLENRVGDLNPAQPGLEVALKYLEWRQKLQTLLSMSSLVLVFGIFGLIARRSFVALSSKSFFPQPIILEGFEYTVLLALAYAPVHAAFNSMGTRIRDSLAPRPLQDDAAALLKWSRLSNKLGDLMQIKLYDWKSFGPVFPILAPFILGLLSDLATGLAKAN
jgi:hypothetical protein